MYISSLWPHFLCISENKHLKPQRYISVILWRLNTAGIYIWYLQKMPNLAVSVDTLDKRFSQQMLLLAISQELLIFWQLVNQPTYGITWVNTTLRFAFYRVFSVGCNGPDSSALFTGNQEKLASATTLNLFNYWGKK